MALKVKSVKAVLGSSAGGTGGLGYKEPPQSEKVSFSKDYFLKRAIDWRVGRQVRGLRMPPISST